MISSNLDLDENEAEQLAVYLEAFRVFTEREEKYRSLWKQYGAVDSYHHVTSKAARTQFYLEGFEDESDPIDLINYTVFLIRNVRAGRIRNEAEQTRPATAIATAQEHIWAGDMIEIDLSTGKAVRQRA